MFLLRKVNERDLRVLFNWRSSERVSRFMLSNLSEDYSKHERWYFSCVVGQSPAKHWIINYKGRDIGFINLQSEHLLPNAISWSFYIGDPNFLMFAAYVPPHFYNYIFETRFPNLYKITAEVYHLNSNVLRMHLYHGYSVTGKRFHETENGCVELVCLELTRETWLSKKISLTKYEARFEE